MPLGPLDPKLAIASLMSGTIPKSESTAGAAGNTGFIPDADHQHPRVSSTTVATITTGNTVSVMFTRQFTKQPGISCTLIEAASQQPVIFGIDDWLSPAGTSLGTNPADGTPIGGAVIRAFRSTTIPQNLVNLLLSAVFNVFGGSVAAIRFTCIAVAQSA